MSANPEYLGKSENFIDRLNLEKNGAWIALLVLLCVATYVGWPYFHQPGNLINIMRQASYTGIIALGMTFVIISGGIDLSVGSTAVFAGSMGVIFMNYLLNPTKTESAELGNFVKWSAIIGGGILVVSGIARLLGFKKYTGFILGLVLLSVPVWRIAISSLMDGLAPMHDSYSLIICTFLVVLFLGIVCGLVNGALIAYGKIVPFITTLGTMSIYRYLSIYIGDAGEFAAGSNLINKIGMSSIFSFTIWETRITLPLPVFTLLLLAIILSFILNSTRYGRYLCAVGSNAKVAEYSAIKVPRVKFFAYGIIGAMIGVSAFLLAGRFGTVSTNNFGIGFEMDAIAAVIIGGTAMAGGRGTIWGTVIGCFMLQIIQNMLNMAGMSPYLQGVIKGRRFHAFRHSRLDGECQLLGQQGKG